MKKRLMIISLVFVFCFTFSCQQGEEMAEKSVADVEAEKANVRAVLDRYVTAWNSLDAEQYMENYCQDNDMVIFSSMPPTHIVGYEAMKEEVQKAFEQYESAEIAYRDEVVKVHSSGEAAWLTCYLDLNFVAKGQEGSSKGIRTTWVLEKRDGKWVIVHAHWSVPSAG